MATGQPVDREALALLAATRRGAISWTRDGRQWAELGLDRKSTRLNSSH
jgi:hypothetical protein